MDKGIEKLIDAAEELCWLCTPGSQTGTSGEEEHYIEFEQDTPAGEDFIFTAWGETTQELAQSVFEYAESFDEAEHVQLNIGGRGAPDAYTLAVDANEIHAMLDTLSDRLLEVVRECST